MATKAMIWVPNLLDTSWDFNYKLDIPLLFFKIWDECYEKLCLFITPLIDNEK